LSSFLIIIKQKGQLKTFLFLVTAAILNGGRDCQPRVTQDLTLLGRLSLMRTVQLMKKMSDASKNIFRVYHIRIIAHKKKWFTRHETDRFLNNHCQEFALLYEKTELSAYKYFAICS
jgi:hypothetical protein